jgi:polysaccharide pyruvyl transferase WcaK-like protein
VLEIESGKVQEKLHVQSSAVEIKKESQRKFIQKHIGCVNLPVRDPFSFREIQTSMVTNRRFENRNRSI